MDISIGLLPVGGVNSGINAISGQSWAGVAGFTQEFRRILVVEERHLDIHFASSASTDVLSKSCETRVGVDNEIGDTDTLRIR